MVASAAEVGGLGAAEGAVGGPWLRERQGGEPGCLKGWEARLAIRHTEKAE